MIADHCIQRPVLTAIDKAMLPRLGSILSKVDAADPFARSPGYFAVTGRKGLWLYGDEDTAMMVARHPNKESAILIFPPFGRDPPGLMRAALKDGSFPSGDRQLARIGGKDAHLAMRLRAQWGVTPEREDVLDWTYPIHLVSVPNVIERKGGGFNNFRAHINQAFRAGYTATPIDPVHHARAINEIAALWALDDRKNGYTFDDLTGPTDTALSLMKDETLPLQGVIVFDRDKPIDFWIWDESDKQSGTATSLVRLSMGDRGAAEFGALKMAEQLQARGFGTICLGGSETQGLDHFKRKLCPVQSVDLMSMRLPR